MADFLRFFAAIGLRLLAIPAALLPRRLWARFDNVPVADMVIPSAVATGVAGAFVQLWAVVVYARRLVPAVTGAVLNVAERQAANEATGIAEISMGSFQAFTAPTVIAALLFTPLGLLGTYLVLSALVRAAANIVGDPWGDPLMTGVDAMWRRIRGRRREVKRRKLREQEEGPEVPDRLLTGDRAGVPGADYVVVSSRRKPGWDAGAFVITPDVWYKLGRPFDFRSSEGLRTAYPLTALQTTEVLRRGVRYELPTLEEGSQKRESRS